MSKLKDFVISWVGDCHIRRSLVMSIAHKYVRPPKNDFQHLREKNMLTSLRNAIAHELNIRATDVDLRKVIIRLFGD